MLNFQVSPEDANYISALLAERPLKESGRLALEWQRQGDLEMVRLQKEDRIRIFDEVTAERDKRK